MADAVFKLDTKEVERSLRSFGRRAPRVASAALNRTAKGVATEWKKAVSEDIGIKQSAVAKQMKVRKSKATTLQSSVSVKDRRIPLIELGARGREPSRGKGRGVTYKIRGQRRRRGDAFISTMPSGYRGVFKRTSKRRRPITELHGPSIHRVFHKYLPKARARASKQFPKELQGLMRKELTKKAA